MSDGACIESYKKCNNFPDCSDHSDEFDCPGGIYDYAGKIIHLIVHTHY